MTFQTILRLPDDAADALRLFAQQRGVPVAVLARMWVMERLNAERKRQQDEGASQQP